MSVTAILMHQSIVHIMVLPSFMCICHLLPQLAPEIACGMKRETSVEAARQEANLEFERIMQKFGMDVLKSDYNYRLSDKAGVNLCQ